MASPGLSQYIYGVSEPQAELEVVLGHPHGSKMASGWKRERFVTLSVVLGVLSFRRGFIESKYSVKYRSS